MESIFNLMSRYMVVDLSTSLRAHLITKLTKTPEVDFENLAHNGEEGGLRKEWEV